MHLHCHVIFMKMPVTKLHEYQIGKKKLMKMQEKKWDCLSRNDVLFEPRGLNSNSESLYGSEKNKSKVIAMSFYVTLRPLKRSLKVASQERDSTKTDLGGGSIYQKK